MTTSTGDLPDFPHHHYGVLVSEIGDDGDWVGHGHIHPMRFIAACNRTARLDSGFRNLTEGVELDTYAELRSSIRRTWAIRRPKCDCPEDLVQERGCDEGHDLDPDPDMWWLSWHDVTGDTPGAFPITLGLWS